MNGETIILNQNEFNGKYFYTQKEFVLVKEKKEKKYIPAHTHTHAYHTSNV